MPDNHLHDIGLFDELKLVNCSDDGQICFSIYNKFFFIVTSPLACSWEVYISKFNIRV